MPVGPPSTNTAVVVAEATAIAVGRVYFRPAVPVTAVASIRSAPGIKFAHQQIALGANANAVVNPAVYRNVTVPVLSGDQTDITSQAVFVLTVNNSPVNLGLTSRFNLLNMRFDYDGKSVSFTEVATPGIGSPTWAPEQTVTIDLDFGAGLTRYFTGKIRQRKANGVNANESIEYEAVGTQALANEVTVVNTDGRPELVFTVGSTLVSGSTDPTQITKTVREAIQDLFTVASSALGAAGIPATIGAPGLEQFNAFLPETLQLRNTGFYAALSQLAGLQPGIKAFWDDPSQKWVFPNLLDQPTLVLNVNSINLSELVYVHDTSDRYTAVKLYSDPNLESLIDGSNPGLSGLVGPQRVTLEPLWDANLQGTWDIFLGTGALGATDLSDDYSYVFRRFRIPQNVVDREDGTPIRVAQRVDTEGLYVDPATQATSAVVVKSRYVKVAARVNFPRRTVVLDYPAISAGDPYQSGSCTPAPEVVLTYWPRGVFRYSFVSSVNSDGTVATTAVTQTSDFYQQSLRYPNTGYIGTAFDLFGVQREKCEIVDRTELTTVNAMARLALLKDVRVEGELPIDGDPLQYAINLQSKVLVRHPSQDTGIASVPAMLTGYTYTFGRRGKNTLSLNTDVSGLVKL